MEHFLARSGVLALALLALPGLHEARAQGPGGFPSKPLRFIVAAPPGGSPDVVARLVGQHLGDRLKQPVLVDNRAGASGNIGIEAAARAAPDGHTIFLAIPNVVINPHLYKLSFDPMTELTAVAQLTTVSFVLLASPEFAPRSIAEVLAVARARPGAVSCGWGGPLPHFACQLLRIQGQADITVVPYKGNAPAMKDLIGGRIDLLLDVPNVALPQVQANRVRAMATTNPKRGAGPFGHLPTVNETLAGFEFEGWQGVLAPAGIPREIVERLNREIVAVLSDDELRKRLSDGGLDAAPGSPEAFAAVVQRDYSRYAKIIREAGIRGE